MQSIAYPYQKYSCLALTMLSNYNFYQIMGITFSLSFLSAASYVVWIKFAISVAISSIVFIAVLRANLSANEGLKSITSLLVILCQIGSKILSPDIALVMIPSNS